MSRTPKRLRSRAGASSRERIMVYGQDLVADLLGQIGMGSMAFLALSGRLPSASEAAVFDAVCITLAEHGMTPMAIASRLTLLGAPESLQGAVAAGLLGMGNRFGGGAEATAALLQRTLARAAAGVDVTALAERVVQEYTAEKKPLPGLGHHMHKPVDPRTAKLFDLAAQHGFRGRYVELMLALAEQVRVQTGKDLPVNATGAIGALCCELGLPEEAPRGIAIIARSIGLVGHLIEEGRQPIAREIWERAEDEVNAGVFKGAEG